MLGRLGMDIQHSIDAYKSLINTAFVSESKSHLKLSSGAISSVELEKVIKKAIRENCNDPRCAPKANGKTKTDACMHQDMLFRDEECIKTAVLALTKANMETLPTLLTTYGISRSFAQCTVSEVAKAASAANNLSGSIKTGQDEEVFIDAQYGYNNPCEVLISEAKLLFSGREMIILSIGTGVNDVVEINDTSEALTSALAKIATTSKQSELRLQNDYRNKGVYYRFNVENGLRDSKYQGLQKPGTISAHTRNYVCENEASILEFVEAFTNAISLPLPEAGERANNSLLTLPAGHDMELLLPQTEERTTHMLLPRPEEHPLGSAFMRGDERVASMGLISQPTKERAISSPLQQAEDSSIGLSLSQTGDLGAGLFLPKVQGHTASLVSPQAKNRLIDSPVPQTEGHTLRPSMLQHKELSGENHGQVLM
ncbi:hypothetical protein Cpir12675_006435 [Ceratocystis pirilliformis]|uniref:Uncharacterized protein n=1 Tax=Ceratocystis pirilliformis TaxID=259994 RepID=A0ABR3YHB4_9PEZI